jgi:hypothetical protein
MLEHSYRSPLFLLLALSFCQQLGPANVGAATFLRLKPEGGYAFIVPPPGASVRGSLLCGVDSQSLSRFDAYEGRLCRRVEVAVRAGGDARRCFTHLRNREESERDARA